MLRQIFIAAAFASLAITPATAEIARVKSSAGVAVIERGAIGQGNSGRNTQVVRSDYFHLASSKFFERSLKLYEGLGAHLNFNLLFA